MDTEPLHASYVATEDDLVTCYHYAAATQQARSRKVWLIMLAWLVGLALVSFLVGGRPNAFFLVLTGMFVVLLLTRGMRFERAVRRIVRTHSMIGRRVAVTALPETLRTEIEGHSESRIRYSVLHAVESKPGGILVAHSPGQAEWIPDRAFASPDAREAFLRRLRAGAPIPEAALPA